MSEIHPFKINKHDSVVSSAPSDEQLERTAAQEHLPEGEHLVVVLRVHEQHLVGLGGKRCSIRSVLFHLKWCQRHGMHQLSCMGAPGLAGDLPTLTLQAKSTMKVIQSDKDR